MRTWKVVALVVAALTVGAATCQPPPPPPSPADVEANKPSPDKYVLTLQAGTVDEAGNYSAPTVSGQIASDGPGLPWHPVGSTTAADGRAVEPSTTSVLVPGEEGGWTVDSQMVAQATGGNTGNCGGNNIPCRSWVNIQITRGDLCAFGHCAQRAWARFALVWRHWCSYAYGCISIGDAASKSFPAYSFGGTPSSPSYFRDPGCPPDGNNCRRGDSVRNYSWNGWAQGGFRYDASMAGHVEIAPLGSSRTDPWGSIRGHYNGTWTGGWRMELALAIFVGSALAVLVLSFVFALLGRRLFGEHLLVLVGAVVLAFCVVVVGGILLGNSSETSGPTGRGGSKIVR